MIKQLKRFAVAITLGLVLAGPWLTPGSISAVFLGWIGALALCSSLQWSKTPIRLIYSAGSVGVAIAFGWLFSTISEFGGFPALPALGIFALFVFGTAAQFALFAFFHRLISGPLSKFFLCAPIAWITAEQFSIRIFPWELAHTQLGFTSFAQFADVAGTRPISFLMIWLCDAVVGVVAKRAPSYRLAFPTLACILAIVYGQTQVSQFVDPSGTTQSVSVIQGNVALSEKHNVKYFAVNRQRYVELSKEVSKKGSLIIWPESAITDFIPTFVEDARSINILPYFGDGSAFILGAVSYDREQKSYNSAFAIDPDARIEEPYHKMILMPFGEYTPFSSIFPWLKDINSNVGDFSAGLGIKVFSVTVSDESGSHKVLSTPLICYEDIVPSLAREGVRKGAELLINLTNDAWFGNTNAPYQHHIIAAFRAIENKRYLIRATNTGYTSIIDPLGHVVADLPLFKEGAITKPVKLLSGLTWYSKTLGDIPATVLGYLGLLLAAWGCVRRRGSR